MSKLIRIINDVKKLVLSNELSNCCPHCGALIPPNAEKCEYCDMPLPIKEFEKVMEILNSSLSNILTAEELQEVLNETRELLPALRDQAEQIFREIEENSRILIEKKIDQIMQQAQESLSDRLIKLEEDITQLMMGVLNKVRIGTIKGVQVGVKTKVDGKELNWVAKSTDEMWDYVASGLSETIIASFESSLSQRKIGDFLYRAGKYDDAIKWYSRAMISIMYPPVKPSDDKLPKYGLAEFIPFGAISFNKIDIDQDNREELIYVPSREIGGLKVINSVINKGGVQWPTRLKNIKRGSVTLPLFGRFKKERVLLAHWENIRMLDSVFYNREGDKLQIQTKNGIQTSIAIYDATVGDVDGDQEDELILFTYPAGVSILKFDDDKLVEIGKFFTGKPCSHIVTDIDGDEADEVIMVANNGSIVIVDLDSDFGVMGLSEKISDTSSILVTSGNMMSDSPNEVYISSPSDGLIQLRFLDGEPQTFRIGDEVPISYGITNIDNENYLISVIEEGGEYALKIYAIEEVLGVLSLSEVGIIPLYLPTDLKLKRPKSTCETEPFYSRPISISLDIDEDNVDELFMGFDRAFIGIDLKF